MDLVNVIQPHKTPQENTPKKGRFSKGLIDLLIKGDMFDYLFIVVH